MKNFDVIIIGGGHNGLVTASYLSKKGKRVLVVEKNENVGGLAEYANSLNCISPIIKKELNINLSSTEHKNHIISLDDNQNHTIEVQNGLTVMEGAVQNDIPGIDADCGGGMACATCHVYVKEDWLDKLPKKEDGEEDMLDMAFEPKKNSRLSCQLIVSNELDGLIVSIPSKQG